MFLSPFGHSVKSLNAEVILILINDSEGNYKSLQKLQNDLLCDHDCLKR